MKWRALLAECTCSLHCTGHNPGQGLADAVMTVCMSMHALYLMYVSHMYLMYVSHMNTYQKGYTFYKVPELARVSRTTL